MVFSFTGISCILLSAGTGAYYLKKSCYSYKKHTMNIYTYLMHILMASCIIGKSLLLKQFHLLYIVRALFFLTTIDVALVS
jgi:hypothetical protein